MRSSVLRFALCSTCFSLPLALAHGHGGKYQGPTDTIPPNTGRTGDPTPPGNPSGPTTPTLPGAPTTPGAKGGPTTPGAGPGVRAGGGGYSRRPNAESGSLEQWEFWWEANDDAFLALKQRLRREATTATVGFFGRGAVDPGAAAARLQASDLARVRVALLAALDSTEADIVDSAAIALARITSAEDGSETVAALTKVLAHPAKTAREAAVLGLGIVGASEAVPVLRELLLDSAAGRAATGQHEVEPMVRAFAAAALGMIGDPAAVGDLERIVIDDTLRGGRDAKAAALRALGLFGRAGERCAAFLHQRLEDVALDRIVRAQAPVALAQLAERDPSGAARATLPTLVERLLSDKSDNDLLRSCAVALGRMATFEDVEAIDALGRVAAKATDEQTRHFAVMALAEIGRRDDDPAAHRTQHAELQQRFLRELLQPRPITATPYGALALGVWARNPRVDKALLAQAHDKLLDELRSLNNPSYRAATAVALGLADARGARPDLLGLFVDEKNQVLKSYVAIGLGLLDCREAVEPLRAALSAKGLDLTVRLQVARALGLLGDRQAVPKLIENLKTADTLAETSGIAQALGLIGDRDAVEPLLTLLADRDQPAIRRGFAAVGLGLLAEKGDLPWNAVFIVGSNYRAKTPALAEIFDIL